MRFFTSWGRWWNSVFMVNNWGAMGALSRSIVPEPPISRYGRQENVGTINGRAMRPQPPGRCGRIHTPLLCTNGPTLIQDPSLRARSHHAEFNNNIPLIRLYRVYPLLGESRSTSFADYIPVRHQLPTITCYIRDNQLLNQSVLCTYQRNGGV